MVDRNDPYMSFNFKVTITPKSGGAIPTAFSNVEGFNAEVTYADYRVGTSHKNSVDKLSALTKLGDVTCKRGIGKGKDLANWFDLARRGDRGARATVVIELMSEDQSEVARTWRLDDCSPSKMNAPKLDAKSSDVAIEELVFVVGDIKYS